MSIPIQQKPFEIPLSNAAHQVPEIKNPPLIDFENISPSSLPRKKWHERAISKIDQFEQKLDHLLPNFFFQNKLDEAGNWFKEMMKPFKELSDWLDKNGEGAWYKQLGIFLAKLPFRVIRNIIRILYNIIKEIVHGVVHPAKILPRIAKMIVSLIHELMLPENWSKIGAGLMGATLGQALITGNPFSTIGLIIGGALICSGLIGGIFVSAFNAPKDHVGKEVLKELKKQILSLPEAALTGFGIGLLVGGIQKLIQAHYRLTSLEEAKKFADEFVKEHKLSGYTDIQLDSAGKISIKWEGSQLEDLIKTHPKLIGRHPPQGVIETPTQYKMIFKPDATEVVVHFRGDNPAAGGYEFDFTDSLDKMYPAVPENPLVNEYGFTSGAVPNVLEAPFAYKA